MKLRKKIHQGVATVEACIVVPLFLFFLLAMANIYFLILAEAHIHQSLSEAAVYTAKYCYLEQTIRDRVSEQKEELNVEDTLSVIVNSVVLKQQFIKCLGEDEIVEKVISGGKKGIVLYTETMGQSDNCFIAKAKYRVRMIVPVFGEFAISLCNQVKQKAFVGYRSTEKMDSYVYITPNQQVYHLTRGCTHLSLDVSAKNSKDAFSYQACCYCGKSNYDKGMMYITRTSNIYHFNRDCSGLKRTIYRIKKSEVGGLLACQRCGN